MSLTFAYELLQFLQPNIPDADLPSPLNLESDQAAFPELGRIVVDQDGHHVSVDDVGHGVSAGNEMELIPVFDMDVTGELFMIAQSSEKPRFLACFCSDHL